MKILLVQLSFLGDTILSTPLIGAIKKRFPEAELTVLTTPQSAELLRPDPRLKSVIVFDKRATDSGIFGLLRAARRLKSERFDRGYSLHRSWRTALLLWLAGIPKRIGFSESRLSFLYTEQIKRLPEGHAVIRNLSLLGEIDEAHEGELKLWPSNSAALPKALEGRRFILLAPGSAWRTKRWNWQGYRDVAIHHKKLGFEVVITGAPSERDLGEAIASGIQLVNLVGKISLAELVLLAQHASLIVCNDSMVLHLASAFKIPTVTVFCATSPKFGFGPWQNVARVLEREGLSCKPCSRHGAQTCPTGSELCMNDLASSKVIEAAAEVLHV